jgi:hypothetical protein
MRQACVEGVVENARLPNRRAVADAASLGLKGRLTKLDVANVHEASMLNHRSHEVEPGSADWRGRRGRGG